MTRVPDCQFSAALLLTMDAADLCAALGVNDRATADVVDRRPVEGSDDRVEARTLIAWRPRRRR